MPALQRSAHLSKRPVASPGVSAGRFEAGLEATFVPGSAPRDGWLALWRDDGAPAGHDTTVTLALPAGARARRRTVPARRVELADATLALTSLAADAPVSGSVRAWSVAARLALELVARGRLLPGITGDGHDAWRVGPLDPDDVARRDRLAAALPPAGHAVATSNGRGPLMVRAPGPLVSEFFDAVADTMVRTGAAAIAAGHGAFATREGANVAPWREWLDAAAGAPDRAGIVLRLEPPADGDSAFAATLLLQSRLDPSLQVDSVDLWSAPDTVLARFGADADTELLLGLRRGARVWTPLGRLLQEARPGHIELGDDDLADLLGPAVDDLAGAGITVLWPSELLAAVELRAVVSTPTPAAVTSAGFTLETMAELRWEASVDGEPLTPDDLAALAEAKRPLVRLRGRWVRADPHRLARLNERRRVGAGEALAAALGASVLVDGEAVAATVAGPLAGLAERLQTIANPADGNDGALPAGLDATLRPYQRRGLSWLAAMADLGLGGVLADDMGLGKTVQLLALHQQRWEGGDERPALVVCPTSLLGNWQREAAHFTPSLPVRRFHGTGRHLDDLEAGALVLATYGTVRRSTEELAAVDWGLVVADEAQTVKNPLSRTARALRSVPAGARIALTGTPVENRLTDLWAVLDWTTPGLLGPLERFRRQVAVPVERDRDPDATARFAALVRPFLLRRRKSDPGVAPDLPPKIETDRVVPLTAEQATLYAAVVSEVMAQIADAEGIGRRGLVLKLLTALKQVCNHPAQYLGQDSPLAGRSGKLDALEGLLDIVSDEGKAALVFTQYVAMARLLVEHLSARGLRVLFLHGGVPVGRRQSLVDAFQAGEADVFVISLKAGGTGLNLTAATHVVHYDRWWNPAVEDQASDRAWRIGQHETVQVHRLVSEGTLEDRIAALLQTKRDLADAVIGAGEGWVAELDDGQLRELVELSGVDG